MYTKCRAIANAENAFTILYTCKTSRYMFSVLNFLKNFLTLKWASSELFVLYNLLRRLFARNFNRIIWIVSNNTRSSQRLHRLALYLFLFKIILMGMYIPRQTYRNLFSFQFATTFIRRRRRLFNFSLPSSEYSFTIIYI